MRQFIQQKLRNLGSNNLKDENEHTSHPAPQRKAAAQTLSHAEPGRNTGEQVNRETSTAENNAKRCASGGQAISPYNRDRNSDGNTFTLMDVPSENGFQRSAVFYI